MYMCVSVSVITVSLYHYAIKDKLGVFVVDCFIQGRAIIQMMVAAMEVSSNANRDTRHMYAPTNLPFTLTL